MTNKCIGKRIDNGKDVEGTLYIDVIGGVYIIDGSHTSHGFHKNGSRKIMVEAIRVVPESVKNKT